SLPSVRRAVPGLPTRGARLVATSPPLGGGRHPSLTSAPSCTRLGDHCGVQATDKIWVNGELVDWADARFHVTAHSLHYGRGVFEGVRCYRTESGPAVFRLTDHLQRLADSARLGSMKLPYTTEQLREATLELIAANGLPGCYVRPIAFFGSGELTVYPGANPV